MLACSLSCGSKPLIHVDMRVGVTYETRKGSEEGKGVWRAWEGSRACDREADPRRLLRWRKISKNKFCLKVLYDT